jgi:long-chain acyl-CoA synthetase
MSAAPSHAPAAPDTLIEALLANARDHGTSVAFRERDYGIWQETTWQGTLERALAVAAGLEDLGVKAGQAVIVVGDNRASLYFSMLGAMMLRAFPAPIFPDVPVDQLDVYTRFGEPAVAIAEDQEQVDKLVGLRERTGRPAQVIFDDPRGLVIDRPQAVFPLDDLIQAGQARLAANPGLADSLKGRAQPDDIAVLLYSSGTTGLPKGVPLRHRNVMRGIGNATQGGYFKPGEELFAYLPTAWVGDFVFTLSAAVALHGTINIPERQETVAHDIREVAPTFYLAAPRAWDNMLTRIQVGMADSTPLKRRLFDWFMPRAVALERKLLAGGRATLLDRVIQRAGEILVYGPIKDHLGLSKVERVFTGGEAMGEDSFLFFRALGIRLKQFYGQTETCGLSAAQVEGDVKLYTVGRPLPGVDIRIDDSGEILVRSEAVISGYFDDAQASAHALDSGWLRTGDAGYLDESGHLAVLGRVSEVVRTAHGERFIPNYIENRIKFSPYVRNVAVTGAGRDVLTAIVCIDLEATGHWAEKRGIAYTSYADLALRTEVLELVAGVIAQVNLSQPEGLRIRRFTNLHKDFDADDGEITRTRKLRRNVVEERYARIIDALYSPGIPSLQFEAEIVYEDGSRGTLSRELRIMEVSG